MFIPKNTNFAIKENLEESHSLLKEKPLGYERYIVYSRYFARITKYLKRSIAVMNNFHASFHNYSVKFEKPLYYIGLACIAMSIGNEFYKVKPGSNTKKTVFFIDMITWHALASFIFPSFIISNSISLFVLLLKICLKSPKILNIICLGCSIIWIPAMVTPIDKMTNFLLDNSLRPILRNI